jgi:hypothetical protein
MKVKKIKQHFIKVFRYLLKYLMFCILLVVFLFVNFKFWQLQNHRTTYFVARFWKKVPAGKFCPGNKLLVQTTKFHYLE